jgi:hypothetical protein
VKPIVQQDPTGCAIAGVAALSGNTYKKVRTEAVRLGIEIGHPKLWTQTGPMRKLLAHFRVGASKKETPFQSWEKLPDKALLAIKWHETPEGTAWHWVVFIREKNEAFVLDPKKALSKNRRTDFGRIKPKWFIQIKP